MFINDVKTKPSRHLLHASGYTPGKSNMGARKFWFKPGISKHNIKHSD